MDSSLMWFIAGVGAALIAWLLMKFIMHCGLDGLYHERVSFKTKVSGDKTVNPLMIYERIFHAIDNKKEEIAKLNINPIKRNAIWVETNIVMRVIGLNDSEEILDDMQKMD